MIEHERRSELHVCHHLYDSGECGILFIKTRKWQTECVGCMVYEGTIDKHPLMQHLIPTDKQKALYKEYYALFS